MFGHDGVFEGLDLMPATKGYLGRFGWVRTELTYQL
jgi:hypothetical protein